MSTSSTSEALANISTKTFVGWLALLVLQSVRDRVRDLQGFPWDSPIIEVRFPAEWDFEKNAPVAGTPLDPAWPATVGAEEWPSPEPLSFAFSTITRRRFVVLKDEEEDPEALQKAQKEPRLRGFEFSRQTELSQSAIRGSRGSTPFKVSKFNERLRQLIPFASDQISNELIPTAPRVRDGEIEIEIEGEVLLLWGGFPEAREAPGADALPFAGSSLDVTVEDVEAYTSEGTVRGAVRVSALLAFYPLAVWSNRESAYFPVVLRVLQDEGPSLSQLVHSSRVRVIERLLEEAATQLSSDLPTPSPASPASPTVQEDTAEKTTFPLAFGPAKADAAALNMARHPVTFPRQLSHLRPWDELVKEEIERLRSEGNEEDRRSLLRSSRNGEVRGLTSEGEHLLLERNAKGKGCRYVHNGSEYLVRFYSLPDGRHIVVGASWYGNAAPFVERWRIAEEKRLEEARGAFVQSQTELPFPREEERREHKARLLQERSLRLGALRDALVLLEVVLGQVWRQAGRRISLPAEALMVLLKRDRDRNWKTFVDAAFAALSEMKFLMVSEDPQELRGAFERVSRFVSGYEYTRARRGSPSHGTYEAEVSSGGLGVLRVFEAGGARLDVRKKLSLEEQEILGLRVPRKTKRGTEWERPKGPPLFFAFDAGDPFYNRAAGFSKNATKLANYLSGNVTLNHHPPREKGEGLNPKAARPYDATFCPLLPETESFVGALGFKKRSPESGWFLKGTGSRGREKSGHKVPGLVVVSGRSLPTGRGAKEGKRRAVDATLDDLRDVVDAWGGVVAVKFDDRWLSLEEARRTLPTTDLYDRAKFFPFLAADWKERRKALFEEATGYAATESVEEAREAAAALRGEVLKLPSGADLIGKLHDVRKERGLSQADAARLFGVSKPLFGNWERRRRPVPENVVPWLVRWIETGEAPSPEEVEARPKPSGGKAPR